MYLSSKLVKYFNKIKMNIDTNENNSMIKVVQPFNNNQ